MGVILTPSQKVMLSVRAIGSQGGDTTEQIEGSCSWSADDSVLALVPSANTLACEAIALGLVGESTVSVAATGPDGRTFAATITVSVRVPLEPIERIEIVAGEPVEQ
jgi:hypothetical protein